MNKDILKRYDKVKRVKMMKKGQKENKKRTKREQKENKKRTKREQKDEKMMK